MQPEYFDRLPPELQQLVLETEGAVGFPVEVVVDAAQAGEGAGEPDPLACEVGKGFARLLAPSVEQLRPGAVFHELLHIRRFLVEGAPMLVDCADYEPWTPAIATALTKHDNAFEHLIIVRRELNEFPERREHWEAVMNRCWGAIAAGQSDRVSRRQLGFACWAFLQHVLPDSPCIADAKAALISSNMLEPANQFCASLLPILEDKPAAMRVWFEHQEIALEMASLKYFQPLDDKAWEIPLAQSQ